MDIEAEVLREFGISLHHKPTRTPEGELVWHTSCPFEGQGVDRFHIFERGNYFCNHCGAKGFLKSTPQRTLQEIAEYLEKQKLEEEIWRKKRLDNLSRWKAAGHEKEVWAWHENNHREYWLSQGISEEAIDQYKLGYCDAKSLKLKTGEITTLPVYTMPIWNPITKELENIQYRLCNPPDGEGKYRQESSIPASAAFMNEDMDGTAIFVEGFKKAIVVHHFIEENLQVVGFPSNLPSADLLHEKCAKFKKIYLIWDPNSDKQVLRMGRLMPEKIWVVTLPIKCDDAIVQYHISKETFRSYFKIAEHLR